MNAPAADPPVGTATALWRLMRPKGAFLVPLLPALGFGLAHWDRALFGQNLGSLPWIMAGWLCLHAGTMWLNAHLDQDEGEVLFGRAAPVPARTTWYGYGALAAAVLLAAWGNPLSGLCALAAGALSIVYSHPRLVLKGHPIGGPAINVLGYGLLSPLAGWVAVGVPLTWRGSLTLVLVMAWMAGWTFAAQAFQRDEDAGRGYRTLVVTHGPSAAVAAGRACMFFAVGGFVAMACLGWYPRILLLALPAFIFADRLLHRWQLRDDGGSQADAMRVVRWMLLGAVGMLALTYAEYLRASWSGEPVSGMATAAGHPPDRPRLAPYEMYQWEQRRGDVIVR